MTSKPSMHLAAQGTGLRGFKVLLLLAGIMALYATSWVGTRTMRQSIY